jgi:hypothetical protein
MATDSGEGLSCLTALQALLTEQAEEANARFELALAAQAAYEAEHPVEYSPNRLKRLAYKAMQYFGLIDDWGGDEAWEALDNTVISIGLDRFNISRDLSGLAKLTPRIEGIYDAAQARQQSVAEHSSVVPEHLFVQTFERPA